MLYFFFLFQNWKWQMYAEIIQSHEGYLTGNKIDDINCYGYVCNKRHLQGSFSLTCGHFCFYVGRRLARGFSLRRILSAFSYNTDYNDFLVSKDFDCVLMNKCWFTNKMFEWIWWLSYVCFTFPLSSIIERRCNILIY